MGALRIELKGGRRWGLAFSYPLVKHKRFTRRGVRAKIVELVEQDGRMTAGRTITEAVVECSNQDQFCKETGRKRALEQALTTRHIVGNSEARVVSKEDSKVIWDAWRNRPRPVSVKKEAGSESGPKEPENGGA